MRCDAWRCSTGAAGGQVRSCRPGARQGGGGPVDGTGDTCSSTTTSCTVSGLTNGTAYASTVAATNADGTSSVSDPSTAVIPSTVPDAPTGVAAVADNASVRVSWTAPSCEGLAITGYTVTSWSGAVCTSSGATSCVSDGLTNGMSYTFTVTATNTDGTGAASSPSAPATPTSVPGAPTSVVAVAVAVAVAGNGQATVTWTAPFNEGLPITSYSVLSTSGHPCTTATTSCVVTGPPNGASTTCTVKATNADGTGPGSSPSNSVVLSSNTAVITSGNTVTIAAGKKLNFTVTTSGTPTPTVGESGIDPWMTLTPGSTSAAGTAKITGKGPATGGTYTFTVEANNGVGLPTMQPFTVHVLVVTATADSVSVTQKLTVTIG